MQLHKDLKQGGKIMPGGNVGMTYVVNLGKGKDNNKRREFHTNIPVFTTNTICSQISEKNKHKRSRGTYQFVNDGIRSLNLSSICYL